MKKFKVITSLFCILAVIFSLFSMPAYADENSGTSVSRYVYTFNIKVDNPANSSDMDKDAVNVLYFEYHYNGKNGYQDEKSKTFDMSWNGSSNKNADFLKEHFIRPNDNSYNTSFTVTLDGKLNRTYIKLNMDGGERLKFTVESVFCNGKRINSNTDYVSSAYNDSTANVYCSMEKSVVDEANSPYFKSNEDFLTEKEMKKVVKGINDDGYIGQFRDQYDAVIDLSVLEKCVGTSDGPINQYYSHYDEESMYKYTFYFNVENPINLNDADYDEVETFYIEINYIDQNGYGSNKTYALDMAYNKDLKRNLNQKYLSYFEKYNDNAYNTHFSLWVPGIITNVKCKLNMSGEKLCAYFEKVTLNSIAVNNDRDYVSSTYYDSSASFSCSVPASQIMLKGATLPEEYSTSLVDQYGAIVSKKLYNQTKEDTNRYLYHE